MNQRDVIIACDFHGARETLEFLDRFGGQKPYVKIGMELFYAAGREVVQELRGRGHRVFLDLKLHDIPNTVKKAMAVLSDLDVDMVNLHAGGGIEMMRAALSGVTRADGTRPKVIAVTMLTSTNETRMQDELLIGAPLEQAVLHYAQNARRAGLDGVVCSPLEVAAVKEACGPDFVTVTPGIRYPDSAGDDQKRVTTPAGARELGSDYIVVGRPITAAPDPVVAYERCVAEFAKSEETK